MLWRRPAWASAASSSAGTAVECLRRVAEGAHLVGVGAPALEEEGDPLQRLAGVHGLYAFLARLGATRGGSSGILGYCGRPGRVVQPGRLVPLPPAPAAARATGGGSAMSAHGSPRRRTRSGTVRMVSSSGATVSTSSHVSGVDTWPPGRGRANQAPNTVLCGAFWLKSTKTRLPALLLPPVGRDLLGMAPFELAGQRDRGGAHLHRVPARLEPQVDVQPVVARGLGVAPQAELGEHVAARAGRRRAPRRSRCRSSGRGRCAARRRGRGRPRDTATGAGRGTRC